MIDDCSTSCVNNTECNLPVDESMYLSLYLRHNKECYKSGYSVVGYELSGRLYMNLLSHGYRIPDRNQRGTSRIRPDKSVEPAFHHFFGETLHLFR